MRLRTGAFHDRARDEKLVAAARYRLDRLTGYARLLIHLEQALVAGLPLIGVLLLFIVVGLLGVWDNALFGSHGLLRISVWFGMVGLLVWAVWHARVTFSGVTRAQALRRLERENGLTEHDFDPLLDHLAVAPEHPPEADNPITLYLWKKHQRAIARRVMAGLTLFLPSVDLYRRDRYALHAPLLILLLVGGWLTGPSGVLPAVRTAFVMPSMVDPRDLSVDVWVNPPAYTGVPPLYLSDTKDVALASDLPEGMEQFTIRKVPEGSMFVAQVSGSGGHVMLKVEPVKGDGRELDLETQSGDLVGTDYELPAGAMTLSLLHQGQVLDQWHLNAVKDRAPSIDVPEPVRATVKQVLRFAYHASDDYGLVEVRAIVTPLDEQDQPDAERTPMTIPLPLQSTRAKEVDQVSFQDLRAHPWAGTAVRIHMEALDDKGQVGQTEPVDIVLPERHFNDPLARAVIEERRRLAVNPYKALLVTDVFNAMTTKPEIYLQDMSAYLGLRAAYWKLKRDMSKAVDEPFLKLLWDIAIHRDGGELAIAEQQVRELQKQLKAALANGASDAEVERLMEALEDSLKQLMKAMASKMTELRDQTMTSQTFMQGGAGAGGTLYRPEDLLSMLEDAKELNRAGARSSAQEMLSRLENILENLNMSGGEQAFGATRLEKMMNDLNGLSREQQGVMDQTLQLENRMDQEFRNMLGQGQRGKPRQNFSDRGPGPLTQPEAGQQGEGQFGQNGSGKGNGSGSIGDGLQSTADMQSDIRDKLERLMGALQKESGLPMPDALGKAMEQMEQAEGALQGGRPDEARSAQSEALDSLAQGTQEFLNRVLSEAGEGSGSGGSSQQFGQQGGTDPLGRPVDQQGKKGGGNNEFDTRSDLSRARRIFEELQRRASERERPREELEYLDRLMKRF